MDECDKRLAKTKKQEKVNWLSEQMLEISKKIREAKQKLQRSGKLLTKNSKLMLKDTRGSTTMKSVKTLKKETGMEK